MNTGTTPNRWLHLLHPKGFSDELYSQFLVHSEVFQSYVALMISNWRRLGAGDYDPDPYVFFEPYLSHNRTLITLPIGGEFSLATRNAFEDSSSRMLWQYMPIFSVYEMLEGFTEFMPVDIVNSDDLRIQTHWRHPLDQSDRGLSPTFDPNSRALHN